MRITAPSLPPGYHAQPAWGFIDRTGRCFCEFNRVYGPPGRLDQPTCRLDEGLSYWSVVWATSSGTGDEQPVGRWLSYAQARKVHGTRLTFERFSSLARMREEPPELLHVGDVSLQARPAISVAPAKQALHA